MATAAEAMLTVDVINAFDENEDDIVSAQEVLDTYGVQYDGLNSLSEYKDRLVLEYKRQTEESPRHSIGNAIVEAGEEDNKKRQRLIQLCRELQSIVDTEDDTQKKQLVSEFLKTERTTDDIVADCHKRVEELKSGDCVILIAGESTAGKSSLLNLLLGEDILPFHTRSCTATITTVRYGRRKHVKVIYKDRDPEVIERLDKEGMKRFWDIAFLQGPQRENEHNVKEVQVFLPVWFLQSGLVLADTPGIGENEFMESYLMKYIAENQVLGFMYIIMSDAAGGIQEDRLLTLLKAIIEVQKKSHSTLKFDPKAALFVCNRFDAVPEQDRYLVKQNALRKLAKYWPEFHESSVVFFSTKMAKRDVDVHPDYINSQYKSLLLGLKNLFCVAMDRRICASYKWMENVLLRITHYLKSTVKRLDMSERERQEKQKKSNEQLSKLRKHSDKTIEKMQGELDTTVKDLCKEIIEYLKTPAAQFRLTAAWSDSEIPRVGECTKGEGEWKWIKEKLDFAFFDRLCALLEEWENDKCRIPDIEARVVEHIHEKLGIMKQEIREAEHSMHTDAASIRSSSSTSSDEMPMSLSRKFSMSIIQEHGIYEMPHIHMKISARIKLVEEMSACKLPLSSIKGMLNRQRTKDYNRNPQKMISDRAAKLLKYLTDNKVRRSSENGEGLLVSLVKQLMQRPYEYLSKVAEKVPSIIEANVQLLSQIEERCVSEQKFLSHYVKMMEDIENLRKTLMDYGHGYIFVQDFQSDEIKTLHPRITGGSMTKTFRIKDMMSSGKDPSTLTDNSKPVDTTLSQPRGLWTVLLPGSLIRPDKDMDRDISIRVYQPSSGVTYTFQEVAKLRCLIHEDVNLSEFLGIHHADAKIPAFIYDGRLQSVRLYMRRCVNASAHMPRLLKEVATGVKYIHKKGLVHMELSPATITVNNNGRVQMTGACLPRRAALPRDPDTLTGDFVYIAPEVLQGELYITTADVYSFGLLFAELTCKKPAFEIQKKCAFGEFAKNLDPPSMLPDDPSSPQTLSHRALALVKGCIEVDLAKRIKMDDVIHKLEDMKGNFRSIEMGAVLRKSLTPKDVFRISTSSSPKAVFRHSSGSDRKRKNSKS